MYLKNESIDNVLTNYLEFPNGEIILKTLVRGRIVNSVPSQNDKDNLLQWKRSIAKITYDKKTKDSHNPNQKYAISLNMRFSPANHHSSKLDVENYVKPVIDAIALGLFTDNSDFTQVTRFNADDSNFNHIYIERLQDIANPEDEGVVIIVSKKKEI